MGDGKRARIRVEGRQETAAIVATLGRQIRAARLGRRLTQSALGRRVGLSATRLSELERGEGLRAPLDVWVALGLAIGRPLAVSLSRDLENPEPRDVGHLDLQEAAVRLARRHGWRPHVELPTTPLDPSFSIDVCACDDPGGRLLLLECWNRFGDLGAAARSTDRKVAEAGELARHLLRGRVATIHPCWLVRPSAANRRLVRRYPALIASRFPGSSLAWARTLNEGAAPPDGAGFVWFDASTGRATPVRLRRARPRS